MTIQLEPSWLNILQQEFDQQYMKDLKQFLLSEKKTGQLVYPPSPLIFNAFNLTPLNELKVVIIGQDPYHGPGQAEGLAFSVPPGVPTPPSLKNIYKELSTDIEGFKIPRHGHLSQWAKQGVLLLNATLTVRDSFAASHQKKGWETFTDNVIRKISENTKDIVFILWGRNAQAKIPLIDTAKHHILKAAHPSPLSAHNGFLGCKHFSQTNALLKHAGKEPIKWQLED